MAVDTHYIYISMQIARSTTQLHAKARRSRRTEKHSNDTDGGGLAPSAANPELRDLVPRSEPYRTCVQAAGKSTSRLPLCSRLPPYLTLKNGGFRAWPPSIQLPLWAPCGRPTWPHAPARPGPRPWLRVLSASSRECLRPPKPLGPGAPRALSATPGPAAASCVVSTHSGPGCIAAR